MGNGPTQFWRDGFDEIVALILTPVCRAVVIVVVVVVATTATSVKEVIIIIVVVEGSSGRCVVAQHVVEACRRR